ncbi:MAG TPA: flagellar basal body-associated FliL family protein [Cellvibrionaceae bacterium]
MATKKPAPAAEPEAAPAVGKSKKRLIIMVVLGVVLIALSIGGTIAAIKFMGHKGDEGKKDEHAKEEHPEENNALGAVDEKGKPRPTIYLELKPEIVVSFDVAGRQRFLKATVNMVTYDPSVEAALTLHQPMIANAMVMLVSKKQFDQLQTVEGKEALRTEAFTEINALIEKETHKKNGIAQVLFSEFVLQ